MDTGDVPSPAAQFVERQIDAWNRGDFDTVLAKCTPDVEWHYSGMLPDTTEMTRGREALRAFWESFTEPWRRVVITVEEVVELGDQVVTVVRFRAEGGHSGALAELRFAWLWSLSSGLVREVRSFRERDEAVAAAGRGGV